MQVHLSPTKQVTAEAVLASHFTLVSQPGQLEILDVEGADGWISSNPHPLLSLARWTTTNPDQAATALDTVLEIFQNDGRGFDWMTGPQDTDLVPLLHDRGFLSPPLSIAAMARPVSDYDAAEDPQGVITELVDDPSSYAPAITMAEGFEIPEDVGKIYHDAYIARSHLQRTDIYTANVEDSDVPVGVGYLSYIGDGPMVLLRVSATLESHRGRGIYRALVKRRLAAAEHAGREVAVVHAYSAQSKSALAELGFETVGELQLHRWRP